MLLFFFQEHGDVVVDIEERKEKKIGQRIFCSDTMKKVDECIELEEV